MDKKGGPSQKVCLIWGSLASSSHKTLGLEFTGKKLIALA